MNGNLIATMNGNDISTKKLEIIWLPKKRRKSNGYENNFMATNNVKVHSDDKRTLL